MCLINSIVLKVFGYNEGLYIVGDMLVVIYYEFCIYVKEMFIWFYVID